MDYSYVKKPTKLKENGPRTKHPGKTSGHADAAADAGQKELSPPSGSPLSYRSRPEHDLKLPKNKYRTEQTLLGLILPT